MSTSTSKVALNNFGTTYSCVDIPETNSLLSIIRQWAGVTRTTCSVGHICSYDNVAQNTLTLRGISETNIKILNSKSDIINWTAFVRTQRKCIIRKSKKRSFAIRIFEIKVIIKSLLQNVTIQ